MPCSSAAFCGGSGFGRSCTGARQGFRRSGAVYRRYSVADVEKACHRLVAGVRPIREWWAGGFDLLLTPATNGIPPAVGAFSGLDPAEESWQLAEAFGLYTVPYSFTGQPAVSLPAAWVDGMPIGIQLVAGYGREDVLLRIASQLEEARPWADRWPPIS